MRQFTLLAHPGVVVVVVVLVVVVVVVVVSATLVVVRPTSGWGHPAPDGPVEV